MITEMESALGSVTVVTKSDHRFTIAELAEMAVNEIITVSSDARPEIKSAVNSYRDSIKARLAIYLDMARES